MFSVAEFSLLLISTMLSHLETHMRHWRAKLMKLACTVMSNSSISSYHLVLLSEPATFDSSA